MNDWQFWVVTAIAAAALFAILRNVLPERMRPFRRGKGKPTQLTIQGRAPADRSHG